MRRALLQLVFALTSLGAWAQPPTGTEVIGGAFKDLDLEKGFAMYFHKIAYGLSSPEQLFSAPAGQVLNDGHVICQGDKFDVKAGFMQGISNGEIYLVVNELERMVIVDSVHYEVHQTDTLRQAFMQFLEQSMPDDAIKLEGEKVVAGDLCHVVRSDMTFEGEATHVYYYVRKSDLKLVLFAEYDGQMYTSYLVKKIGPAPKRHDYSFTFPEEEQTEFMGYKVFDFRYANFPKEHR